jgi:hypothetical protein
MASGIEQPNDEDLAELTDNDKDILIRDIQYSGSKLAKTVIN